MDLVSAIERRHSVRRYKRDRVPQEMVRRVVDGGKNAVPLCPEIAVRWYIVWNGGLLARRLGGLAGVYGLFTSAPHYIIAVSQEHERFMENLGFCMEQLILTATALGLGTCWIGGLFTESSLRDFTPDLLPRERIVAITPLGYADDSQAAQTARRVVRWGTEYRGKRKPISEIASQDIWDAPWNGGDAKVERVLYLTSLAPSWANTQPWHFVMDERLVIATVENTPRRGNVREGKPYYRLDGGIAMCHFYLAARALGWDGGWEVRKYNEEALRTRYRIPIGYDILGVWRGNWVKG